MDLTTVLFSVLVIFYGVIGLACVAMIACLPRMIRNLNNALDENSLPV